MNLDPLKAYKNSLTDPEEKAKFDAGYDAIDWGNKKAKVKKKK